ncbi:hypothetical protein B296_00032330, partial [Ensete ventricosum]
MAKPLVGVVGHSLATCKGQSTVAKAPCRGSHPQGRSPIARRPQERRATTRRPLAMRSIGA